jgi:hypothetical protein
MTKQIDVHRYRMKKREKQMANNGNCFDLRELATLLLWKQWRRSVRVYSETLFDCDALVVVLQQFVF